LISFVTAMTSKLYLNNHNITVSKHIVLNFIFQLLFEIIKFLYYQNEQKYKGSISNKIMF